MLGPACAGAAAGLGRVAGHGKDAMNPIVNSLLNSLATAQQQLALHPGNTFWASLVQHLEQALHALGF